MFIFCVFLTLQVSTIFAPGSYQGFALVNRQRTNRIDSGFSVELSTDGTQLSYTNFNYLGQEPHYWQLPRAYQEDKVDFSNIIYFIILTSLLFSYMLSWSIFSHFEYSVNWFHSPNVRCQDPFFQNVLRAAVLQLRNAFIEVGVYTRSIIGTSINKLCLGRLNLTHVSFTFWYIYLFWMWYTELRASESTCSFRRLTLLGLDVHTR